VRFWVDGRLVDAAEARVSALDHGFTVGDGVFETLKVVPGPQGDPVPFALDRHLARLEVSAAGLGLPPPDVPTLRDAALSVCAASPELAGGGRLRVTYTSGAGPLGSDRGGAPATAVVTAAVATGWPPTGRLALSPWRRNEAGPLTGLKTTSYAENVVMLAHARSLGADEALVRNLAGSVCEGTGSNIFAVHDGVIRTPALSSGCLAGITRELVVQWCAEAGTPVCEQELAVADVVAAQELFLTSSTRDVHPVVEVLDVSGASLWAGPVGPVTRATAALFADRAAASWNP
jgi:branched-chain amino acid aminotransferase